MTQVPNRWVTAEDMVRSRAWRSGFESYRRGEDPEYMGRGSKALAYEYGRLTAAYLKGEGLQLPLITARRPVNEAYVPKLSEALSHCAGLWTAR